MKKLYELLGFDPVEGDFGVEIECEGANLFPHVDKVWNCVDDGSLRGRFPTERCEWVLSKPLPLDKAIKAVQDLEDVEKKQGAVLNFSFRTSTHVHVNVQQLTRGQYLAMLYAYFLVEEPLMNFCGKQRVGNRFCLRLQDAEGLLDHVEHLFQNRADAIMRLGEDQIRYAAVNMAATRKYGSLEFRGMRGTLDTGVLTTWLKTLNNLRKFAIEMDNPKNVHDFFVRNHPEDFFRAVVGDVANAYPREGITKQLRYAFSITMSLPYSYREIEEKQAKGNDPRVKIFDPDAQMVAMPAGWAPAPARRGAIVNPAVDPNRLVNPAMAEMIRNAAQRQWAVEGAGGGNIQEVQF